MPAPTSKNAEDQVRENKRRLKNAEDARVLKSWLKDVADEPSQHSLTGASSLEGQDEEGDDDFSADSDTGGLGFVKNTNSNTTVLLSRQGLSSNDKLRKQLVGNNVSRRKIPAESASGARHASSTSRPKRAPASLNENGADDEDEDDARTKAMTSTKPRRSNLHAGSQSRADTSQSTETRNAGKSTADKIPAKKRATSYLDEMLARRSRKRTKKSDADGD